MANKHHKKLLKRKGVHLNLGIKCPRMLPPLHEMHAQSHQAGGISSVADVSTALFPITWTWRILLFWNALRLSLTLLHIGRSHQLRKFCLAYQVPETEPGPSEVHGASDNVTSAENASRKFVKLCRQLVTFMQNEAVKPQKKLCKQFTQNKGFAHCSSKLVSSNYHHQVAQSQPSLGSLGNFFWFCC